jgi:pimeloyl-ACP methyl ester carboxylesterase
MSRSHRLRFPYANNPLTNAAYAVLVSRAGWKASRAVVGPSIHLNGLVRRPAAPDAPWVLFYPGNDANMLTRAQSFLASLAGNRDWGLAVYAYRGYDSSGGDARLPELAADAPEILAQLSATEQLRRSRIHIVGFSIGGHLAVRAVAATARQRERPASLTLLAAVDDIVMYRHSLPGFLGLGDEYKTEPLLDSVPAPVLVVQGVDDEALQGPGQGRAIASRLGSRARYVELPGAGHSALLEDERVFASVREFVDAHDGKPTPQAV